MTNLTVRKSNKIVQQTINKFNYKQNQIMGLLLSKYVNLESNECINTSISIKEIRELLEVTKSKNNNESIVKAINRFGEIGSIGVYDIEKNSYKWIPFFTLIEIKENEVNFEWNEHMKPFLIELKNNYTQYLANDYLKLKSVYSQNLYEQLKSVENYKNAYGKNPIITVEDLKKAMNIHEQKAYQEFKRFKDHILNKAIKEINEVTDINVTMNTLKKGVKIVALEFNINKKEQTKQKDKKTNKKAKYEAPTPIYTSENNIQVSEEEIEKYMKGK